MAQLHEHAHGLKVGSGPGRQRGFGAFLMMVMIAGLIGSAAMFSFFRTDRIAVAADRKAADSMAEVKAALLAYATSRGGPTGTARPGELPCPDTDGDGIENTPCTLAPTLLGRVPWRTLNIQEPKDSSGETLWYAISTSFRDSTSNPASGDRINSDTRGTITVLGADGATLTDNAVAVIIAPGPATNTQNRGLVGAVTCTLTALSVTRRLCANNYLETWTGTATGVATNNAGSTSGPFIAGGRSDTFNDRVSFISTAELIAVVEVRVAREIMLLLQSHYSVRGFYPWADTWPYSGGISDTGQNRGRFASDPSPAWGTNGVRALPAWLKANDWHNLIWYTVSYGYTENNTCSTCAINNAHVTLDGVQVQALFFTPGPPSDGLPRLTSVQRRDNMTLYLDDATNRNGANAATCPDTGETGDDGSAPGGLKGQLICDIYVTPTSTALERDRVYKIP